MPAIRPSSILSAVVCTPSCSTVTIARQAVDEAVAHAPRRPSREDARDPSVKPHDVVETDNGPLRRRPLAAAVGIEGDVRREKRAQLIHVAAPGGRVEGGGDLEAALLGHRKARTRGAHMRARPAGELAAGRGLAADRLGDLLEADAEHVVQQEGGALERRQSLERHHQRQRDVVDCVLVRLRPRVPAATARYRFRAAAAPTSNGRGRGG